VPRRRRARAARQWLPEVVRRRRCDAFSPAKTSSLFNCVPRNANGNECCASSTLYLLS
jgi:hypothetical protein